jgi:hypothetical protein
MDRPLSVPAVAVNLTPEAQTERLSVGLSAALIARRGPETTPAWRTLSRPVFYARIRCAFT